MLRSRVLAGITYPGPQSWKRGADLNSSPWLLFTFLLTIVVQLLLRQAGGITIYLIVSPCYGLPHPISLCPGVLIVINSLPVYRVKSGKFYNLCKEKENTIWSVRGKINVTDSFTSKLCLLWWLLPYSLTHLGTRHPTPRLTGFYTPYLCAVSQYPAAIAAATLICFPLFKF